MQEAEGAGHVWRRRSGEAHGVLRQLVPFCGGGGGGGGEEHGGVGFGNNKVFSVNFHLNKNQKKDLGSRVPSLSVHMQRVYLDA